MSALQISAKVVGSPHPVRARASVAVMPERTTFVFIFFLFVEVRNLDFTKKNKTEKNKLINL